MRARYQPGSRPASRPARSAPLHWVAVLSSAAGLVFAGCLATAATYLISPDSTGWFPTIQEALDVAVDGDSVVLADGVFELNQPIEFRGAAIVLCSLSGDPANCALVPQHERQVVHFWQGESNATILEGVTIRDAYNSDGYGGGVLCYQSSPTIRNCVLKNNHAVAGAGIECSGGGAVIESCLFEGNVAGMPLFPGWGGGICVTEATCRIVNCTFIGNAAGGTGGAIDGHNAQLTVSGCRILGNYAEGICCSGGVVDIGGCVIAGNTGSGVLCHRCTATLTGLTVAGNNGYLKGGGMWILDGAAVVAERCAFWGNCADEGAGGIQVDGTGQVEFVCCVVDSARVGGDGSIMGLDSGTFADPLFCSPMPCSDAPSDLGDYSVSEASPCTPERSPCSERIGALPAACPTPPATQSTSWGALKNLFRVE